MGKGDKPKDARETLNQLEKRLRDLERELRAGVPEQPAPEPAPVAPEPEPHVPAAATAAPSAPAPPAAAAPPAPVPAEIEVLVDEARVRADALRESLTSLVGVNDHLRETANTVIEDHGRALAQLDEALSAAEADARAGREPDGREAFAAIAPVANGPATPPWEATRPPRRRRRRWLTVLLVLLLLAAAAAAAYVVRERRRNQSTAPAVTQVPIVAATVPGAMELGITGARRYDATAATQAVCSGLVDAAIVEASAAADCPSVIVLVTVTDSAFGLVGPRLRGGRGRRCFSLVGTELAPHNDIARRNEQRATAVSRARATATGAARGDQLPPARIVRAGNDAAAEAARTWDVQHGLRARAIAAKPGAACVLPTAEALRTGTYPLAHRVSLIATSRSRTSPPVVAAAASLRTAYGGATPLDAHVLR